MRIGVSEEHWKWLSSVSSKCQHVSIDKTLRIMLDWYKLYATANSDNLANEIWGCSDWGKSPAAPWHAPHGSGSARWPHRGWGS